MTELFFGTLSSERMCVIGLVRWSRRVRLWFVGRGRSRRINTGASVMKRMSTSSNLPMTKQSSSLVKRTPHAPSPPLCMYGAVCVS